METIYRMNPNTRWGHGNDHSTPDVLMYIVDEHCMYVPIWNSPGLVLIHSACLCIT